MAKKVLIISTSLRGGSNSDILANECAKGAKEAGEAGEGTMSAVVKQKQKKLMERELFL